MRREHLFYILYSVETLQNKALCWDRGGGGAGKAAALPLFENYSYMY